ncbi:MAG TPA: mechanosensitive ion channel family protein [Erysipelotrichaceae bacterium]|nr:mechanosensitive ion channel family protein [Erysipelotrichaceae bacterium]
MDFTKLMEKIKEDAHLIIADLLIIIVVFTIARIILGQVSKFTEKAIKKSEEMEDRQQAKSIVTSMTMFRSIIRYVIYFIAVAVILYKLGFGNVLSNLLVTAGIGSLAISFGAQSVIQDVVTGLFLIFERQYAVGDFVKIGQHEGIVTSIAMRVTYLDCLGKKVIIPNGKISEVINYSNDYSIFTLTVPIAYKDNTKEAIDFLQNILDKYYNENRELFLEEPKVFGVTNLNVNSVDVFLRGKVVNMKHWPIERELRLIIKEEMDKKGMYVPYTQIVINNEK